MESVVENRAHRRLGISLPLEFHHADYSRSNLWHTVTTNVSTGGLYFETTVDDINVGDMLSLEIGVDPFDQRFPPNGRITTIAEVVRVVPTEEESLGIIPALTRYGIAAKYSRALKLAF